MSRGAQASAQPCQGWGPLSHELCRLGSVAPSPSSASTEAEEHRSSALSHQRSNLRSSLGKETLLLGPQVRPGGGREPGMARPEGCGAS